jgi:hypothetical protein
MIIPKPRNIRNTSRDLRVVNCRGDIFPSCIAAAHYFHLVKGDAVSRCARGVSKYRSAGRYGNGNPVRWRFYLGEELEGLMATLVELNKDMPINNI